ncbi:DUF2076 domain-containing protein [Buchnera aphidicola]|uniref:DUF2076 domain-containing protein n=1 Tax=Buchnera aphidicola TaxID=9 RepID=UPI0031B8036F
MENKEKKLIKNLFLRLKDIELKNVKIDSEVNILIKDIIKKQCNAPYYMTQTILIQESAMQSLYNKINKLENIIKNYKKEIYSKNKSNGFLSNLFNKKKIKENDLNKKDCVNKNFENNNLNKHDNSYHNGTGGFLKNALQTAIGVAGGVVSANMLMNLFNNNKSPSEIFNTENNSESLKSPSENIDNDFNKYVINEEENSSQYNNDFLIPENLNDLENSESFDNINSDDNDEYL